MDILHYKYPKTPHLKFSPGVATDDDFLLDHSHFVGEEIIILEKMDGENATLYADHYHARSLDSAHHESRAWIKSLHGQIKHEIPEDIRICGENMFAQHSIAYSDLLSYFYVFSVWNNVDNICLDWDTTLLYANLLNLTVVPQLWRGVFDEERIHAVVSSLDLTTQEGIVIRTTKAFKYDEFDKHVAKWVRKNHVVTDEHWMHKQIVPNLLRS